MAHLDFLHYHLRIRCFYEMFCFSIVKKKIPAFQLCTHGLSAQSLVSTSTKKTIVLVLNYKRKSHVNEVTVTRREQIEFSTDFRIRFECVQGQLQRTKH